MKLRTRRHRYDNDRFDRFSGDNRCVAGLLLMILAAGCSAEQAQVQPEVDNLRTGEYLREDYIHALCDTLSPLRATRTDDNPQLIIVGRDKAGTSFMPNHNFHEGDSMFRLSRNRMFKPDDQGASNSMNFRLRVRGAESFSLLKGNMELAFRFVGDAGRWVTEAVLTGRYKDAQGKPYIFGPGGEASFPGNRRFKYALGMDHVLNPFDYIYSADLEKTWAVAISRTKLLIYEVHGDHDEIVAAKPKWSLERLTPPSCK